MAKRTCSIDGCDSDVNARGLCPMHYSRWKRFGDPNLQRTAADRFWPKVQKTGNCWEWQGSRNAKGYGQFITSYRRATAAHRWSYEARYGPIPSDMVVCHRCDNPPCVRPDHLFLGTDMDNALDREHKGRGKYPPLAVLKCGQTEVGTLTAYYRHRKRKEPACVACADAWNAYKREYRTRTG